MRETELKSKIAHELRTAHKCFVVALSGSQYQMPGLPDMLIVKDGLHIWVECKNPETVTRKVQERVHQQLKEQQVDVHILRFMFPNEWILNDYYRIQFKTFKQGVSLLLSTLIDVSKPKQLTKLEILR